MMSLNETFERKGSSQVIPTYNARDGANLSYQLEMTVNANVQDAKKDRLVSYVKNTKGYDSCDINTHNNTVRIYSVGGLDCDAILKFIKKNIDKNATRG